MQVTHTLAWVVRPMLVLYGVKYSDVVFLGVGSATVCAQPT